jgi:hypothetical protein
MYFNKKTCTAMQRPFFSVGTHLLNLMLKSGKIFTASSLQSVLNRAVPGDDLPSAFRVTTKVTNALQGFRGGDPRRKNVFRCDDGIG